MPSSMLVTRFVNYLALYVYLVGLKMGEIRMTKISLGDGAEDGGGEWEEEEDGIQQVSLGYSNT